MLFLVPKKTAALMPKTIPEGDSALWCYDAMKPYVVMPMMMPIVMKVRVEGSVIWCVAVAMMMIVMVMINADGDDGSSSDVADPE